MSHERTPVEKPAHKQSLEAARRLQESLAGGRAAGRYSHVYAACGFLDADAGPVFEYAEPGGGPAIFDLASLTKALVTTPLLFLAQQRGELSLSAPLASWIAPASARWLPDSLARLNAAQLLAHRSGLPDWRPFWIREAAGPGALGEESARDWLKRRLAQLAHSSGPVDLGPRAPVSPSPGDPSGDLLRTGPTRTSPRASEQEDFPREGSGLPPRLASQGRELVTGPGAAIEELLRARGSQPYLYSDVGFILLGLCLEERYRRGLAALFYEELCARELQFDEPPLVFADRLAAGQARLVPTAYCHVRGRQLLGEVHDENAACLDGIAAHAGLFGSGPMLRLFLAKLCRSELGQTLLAANAACQASAIGEEGLLGWHDGGGVSARGFAGGRAMGHLGFTGTAFWLEARSGGYGILLTNRVVSGRLAPWNTEFRRETFSHFNELLWRPPSCPAANERAGDAGPFPL